MRLYMENYETEAEWKATAMQKQTGNLKIKVYPAHEANANCRSKRRVVRRVLGFLTSAVAVFERLWYARQFW